eukprot:EG_transcript_7739
MVGGGDWPAYTPPRRRQSDYSPSHRDPPARAPPRGLEDSLWRDDWPAGSQPSPTSWKSWQRPDPTVVRPFNATYTDLNAPYAAASLQSSPLSSATLPMGSSAIMNVPVSMNVPITFNVPVAVPSTTSTMVYDAGPAARSVAPSVGYSMSMGSPLVPSLPITYSPLPITITETVTETVSAPPPLTTVVRYTFPASPPPVTITETVSPLPPVSTVVRYTSPSPSATSVTQTTSPQPPTTVVRTAPSVVPAAFPTVAPTVVHYTAGARPVIPLVPAATSSPAAATSPTYRWDTATQQLRRGSPVLMVRPVLGTRSPQRRPLSPAQALDAADGVMDGRFFGHPIVQPSPIRRRLSYTPEPNANRPRVIGVQYIHHGPAAPPSGQSLPPRSDQEPVYQQQQQQQQQQQYSTTPVSAPTYQPAGLPREEEYVLAPTWDPTQPPAPSQSPPGRNRSDAAPAAGNLCTVHVAVWMKLVARECFGSVASCVQGGCTL